MERTNGYPLKNKALMQKVQGLNNFVNNLESDFFAKATVTGRHNCVTSLDLDVELHCNFGLTETLFHFNNGNWGNFHFNTEHPNLWKSPLENALKELSFENNILVDLNELTIQFKDSSLIITKIYPNSISSQLQNIITSVSENFVHFTKRLSEMPYEIFVPVFEDDSELLCDCSDQNRKQALDYFHYWGLYFDSAENPSIYNLKDKTIIDESDFFFLNQ